mmetsp:Transcript_254/g.614  ORF Transcript_254/g.614 Transcript_254/m.614 type:complete len:632 (+) Transcript_254:64-1959(+)
MTLTRRAQKVSASADNDNNNDNDNDNDVENPSRSNSSHPAAPSSPVASSGAKRSGRLSSLKLLRWRRWLQQKGSDAIRALGSKDRRDELAKRVLYVLAVGIAIATIAKTLLWPPPGKNYFDPDFWRRSHSLSEQQLTDLREAFPLHVGTNNADDMESIAHPGYLFADKERLKTLWNQDLHGLNMTVPKFWDPVGAFGDLEGGVREFLGNHGKYVPTPIEASAIGSFHEGKRTIFLAIASYRDPECLPTLESAFARAKHPERVRVAVVDQREPDETDTSCEPPGADSCRETPEAFLCRYSDRIDYVQHPAMLMVGPVFARHLVNRMYRGEYFAMQVDSHVRFVADWDEDIIDQWNTTGNEMAVITNYMTDIGKNNIDPETHKSLKAAVTLMCKFEYEWRSDSLSHIKFNDQSLKVPRVDSPMLHPFWAAGFSFGRGHFVVSVPYDHYLPFIFQGEEILQTIRGFTYGYDFYAPSRSIAYHIYAKRANKKRRNKIHKFTENQVLYGSEVKTQAYHRLVGISGTSDPAPDYSHLEEERYGLGRIRSREQFFNTFGIHPQTKTIEDGLCSFVEGIPKDGAPTSMHTNFKPFLRYDKMGIDYSRIQFQHKAPQSSLTSVSKDELEALREAFREKEG